MLKYFLLLLVYKMVFSQFTYIQGNYPQVSNLTYYAYSFNKVESNHFTFLITDALFTKVYHLLCDSIIANSTNYSYSLDSFDITNLTSPYVQQITTQGNIAGTHKSILLFTNQNVTLFNSNFGQKINILNVNTTISNISLAFFITNSTSQIIILKLNLNSNYTLHYYSNNTRLKTLIIPVPSTQNYLRILKNRSYFFLSFTCGIYIFSMDSTLKLLNSLTFPSILGSNSIFSMDSQQNYFTYSIDANLKVYDITNINLIQLYTQHISNSSIDDVRISYPYIIFTSNNIYLQYDINLKIIICQFTNITAGQRFQIFQPNVIITFKDFPNSYSVFHTLVFNQSYIATLNVPCLQGYYLNLTECIKNMSYSYIKNNTYINSTLQLCYIRILNGTLINQISIDVGKTLAFTNLRLLPNFLRCFSLFLDDLWYYKFHRYKYPQSAQFFMQKVDIINQFRLNSWYLSDLKNIGNLYFDKNNEDRYNNFFKFHQNNPQSIYFINSSQDFLIINPISNVILFIFTKLFTCFLYRIRNCSKTANKIYSYFYINTRWWILFTMMIQSSIANLTFNCALQTLLLSNLNFSNKLNMILSIIIFFCVLFYSCGFYPAIYYFQKKNSAENLLSHSRYKSKSFYLQSFCFFIRNFIRGLIHGTMLYYYQSQILALTISDVIFIIFPLMFYRQFSSKFVFVCILIYNVLFFGLDLTFYLKSKQINVFQLFDYQLFIFTLIWTIILFYLLSIGSIICFNLYKCCKQKKTQIKFEEIEDVIEKNDKKIKICIRKQLFYKASKKKRLQNKSTQQTHGKHLKVIYVKNNSQKNGRFVIKGFSDLLIPADKTCQLSRKNVRDNKNFKSDKKAQSRYQY